MPLSLDHTDIWLLVLLFFLVGISGFFSSSETGIMAVNRYRLRYLAKHNHRMAKQVLNLLKRPDRLLGVILIGNTFANILASSVATVLAVKFFGQIGVWVITILLTLVILIFSEMAPKTLAAIYAERVAFFVVFPLTFLLYVFYPIVWVANLVE
jgi:Mg2+/Co2+ transporter CorB